MDPHDFEFLVTSAGMMAGFDRPWAVTGGWALDVWTGRLTRPHRGIRIAILRDDQIMLRDYALGWKFWVRALDGRLIPWKTTNRQMLMLPVDRLRASNRWGHVLEFVLEESQGEEWIYRHNSSVRMHLSSWVGRPRLGLPVVNPSVVLLEKSVLQRPQDDLDFRSVLGVLDEPQRTWLKLALMRCNPDHPWLDVL